MAAGIEVRCLQCGWSTIQLNHAVCSSCPLDLNKNEALMIFQGAGIFVLLALAIFIPFGYLVDLFLGPDYYRSHVWPKSLCLILSGAVVWFIGKSLNEESNENEFAPIHSFMFLKMEYWGVVFAAIALLIFLLP